MKYRVVQTDNGCFPPIFDLDTQKILNCCLRLVNVHTERETLSACKDAHLVLATRGLFTKKVLKKMNSCLAIIRFGVGVENINVKLATELGIVVANVPDFGLDEVSDTVVSFILALNRKLISMHQLVTDGYWNRNLARPIHRLQKQTLGLIGFGRIAKYVATKVKSLGMNIIAYDPYVKKLDIKKFFARPVSLNALLEQSDFISLHLPLSDETYHLIRENQLRRMKRTAYLINTSRGKIIDEAALYKAFKKKWIAGAALDVLEREPPQHQNPLLKLKNVILTPHFASYSEDSFKELERKVRKEATAVLKGHFPDCIVNSDVKRKARLLSYQKVSK